MAPRGSITASVNDSSMPCTGMHASSDVTRLSRRLRATQQEPEPERPSSTRAPIVSARTWRSSLLGSSAPWIAAVFATGQQGRRAKSPLSGRCGQQRIGEPRAAGPRLALLPSSGTQCSSSTGSPLGISAAQPLCGARPECVWALAGRLCQLVAFGLLNQQRCVSRALLTAIESESSRRARFLCVLPHTLRVVTSG